MISNQTDLQRIDYRRLFPWVHLFRAFRIAIDPRKLILAGMALVSLAVGEALFSYLPFWEAGSEISQDSSSDRMILIFPWQEPLGYDVPPLTGSDQALGLNSFLDAPGTVLLSIASNWQLVLRPVREPLQSTVMLFQGDLSWAGSAVAWTRLLWLLLVWGLFGGAITRIAAVQFARDQNIGLVPALKFAVSRYLSFVSAPLVAVGFLGVFWIMCVAAGYFGRIPFVGDVVLGLLWIVPLLLGLVMAIILIGGVPGWPLMYATISTEDSDAFDGFSRSYSYVYSRPWHYLWYAVVAMIYGSVVIFFVITVASLVSYLAFWAVSAGGGFKEIVTIPEDVPTFITWMKKGSSANSVGELLSLLWMQLWAVLVHGFVYSYFWTSVTIMYFLLRQSEDAVELDVVSLPEDSLSQSELPLVGVAASDQPVVERPAKSEEEQKGERDA
ncbi:MAG: hypothetical protein IID46_05675 [Planctomycetes bacterium]|nr:hypothetical protein [Planctomycetota bacterium]